MGKQTTSKMKVQGVKVQGEAKSHSQGQGSGQSPGPGMDKPPKQAPAVTPPAKPVPEKLPGR